ncbi:MAG: hypothetical protein DI554_00820 [Sphingobium sp.]|nr:MAG: hypothetical protein DI554_00820 [Sphingobium sp.]
MKFEDIENIWTVDLSMLSNAHRGRVFFERAKQVVQEALDRPELRDIAVEGKRFRRDYLIERIGSQPAVTTQNPKIKQLLADVDSSLGAQDSSKSHQHRPTPGARGGQTDELQEIVDGLRRKIELQAAEILDLKRQLREAGWAELELVDHGRLPW